MKKILNTEVGLLAVWDSESLAPIKTNEDYQAVFVEDRSMVELMKKGQAVIWGTGGDGAMGVTVRVNPSADLEPVEEGLVEMTAKNYKLVTTSANVVVGSPECVGGAEKECLKKEQAFKVEGLEKGQYLVNVYFLYDSRFDSGELDPKDTRLDKTGYIVTLKKVPDNYDFSPVTELPQLG